MCSVSTVMPLPLPGTFECVLVMLAGANGHTRVMSAISVLLDFWSIDVPVYTGLFKLSSAQLQTFAEAASCHRSVRSSTVSFNLRSGSQWQSKAPHVRVAQG